MAGCPYRIEDDTSVPTVLWRDTSRVAYCQGDAGVPHRRSGPRRVIVRRVEALSELEALSESWAALSDAAGARHYAQPFWCLAWWRHFGHGDLHVVTVESEGRLLALAPLRRSHRFGIDVLTFPGRDLGPVMEIVVAPGEEQAAEELWMNLQGHGRWVLDLPNHRLGGSAVKVLRRMEGSNCAVTLEATCPTVQTSSSWDEFLKGRDGNLRRKLRRANQAAEREGLPLRVEIGERPEDVDRLLPDLDHIYEIAERAQPRLHFLAGELRAFTIEILQEAARAKRLALVVLYVDEQPVATAFGFRSGDALCYSGPRFDPAFSQLSPGHLVLAALIEHAHRIGVAEVDLLLGDTRYKREWSTGSYDTVRIEAASSSLLYLATMAKRTATQSSWNQTWRRSIRNHLTRSSR